MFVGMAQIDIKPEHRDAYVAEMIAHARRCLGGEPGTVRFEIIQDESDPNRIIVSEGYRDRSAYKPIWKGKALSTFARQPQAGQRVSPALGAG